MKALRAFMTREGATTATLSTTAKTAARATRTALGRLAVIGGLFTAAEVAKNPWWVAKARADITGAVLADDSAPGGRGAFAGSPTGGPHRSHHIL